MTRSTTPSALLLLLLAGSLTACGGSDAAAAPDDASDEAYCDAFASQFETLSTLEPDDARAAVDASHAWAEQLQEAGTPSDMPKQARRGFEVFADELAALDADASVEDLEEVGTGQQDEVEAFVNYSLKTCPDALSGALGDAGDRMQEELEGQLGDLDLGELEDELGDLDLGDLEDELPTN